MAEIVHAFSFIHCSRILHLTGVCTLRLSFSILDCSIDIDSDGFRIALYLLFL
jgi:hypothetical protein